jgi:hypothetical protein
LIRRRRTSRLARAALLGLCACSVGTDARSDTAGPVDTALVLAIDVSNSVDERRFQLQLAGIASAFEDRAVQDTILSGRYRSILVALVSWSDKPRISIPWTRLGSVADARRFAEEVRRIPRPGADFTCMSAAMQVIHDKVLPLIPSPADRTIIDVSGDGRDNCNPATPVDAIRAQLVASGATVNGLPILEGEEALTLENWYEAHVIGGDGAFVLPAVGYKDFGRAIRQKFIIEISQARLRRLRATAAVD